MVRPNSRRAICILNDPEKIRLIADYQRSEILRLLDEQPRTETQLSDLLNLTPASIGYHLNLLMEAGLIELVMTEPEEHGVLQKYYSSIAALFIPEFDRIPEESKKYFIEMQMQYVRGVVSALHIHQKGETRLKVSSEMINNLSVQILREIADIGRKYEKWETGNDREKVTLKIYSEALVKAIRNTNTNLNNLMNMLR
jgi:DNA-binding transcriptional ArsR family regulator